MVAEASGASVFRDWERNRSVGPMGCRHAIVATQGSEFIGPPVGASLCSGGG
jgi:hypothetical protein